MKPNICPRCHFTLPDINRSNAQNRALHLFFEWIANMFNEVGHTYTDDMGFETLWMMEDVKRDIWKRLQKRVYGHDSDSTTKLTTPMINLLADTIIKHYSEMGYYLEFPSMEAFLNEMDKKNYLS